MSNLRASVGRLRGVRGRSILALRSGTPGKATNVVTALFGQPLAQVERSGGRSSPPDKRRGALASDMVWELEERERGAGCGHAD